MKKNIMITIAAVMITVLSMTACSEIAETSQQAMQKSATTVSGSADPSAPDTEVESTAEVTTTTAASTTAAEDEPEIKAVSDEKSNAELVSASYTSYDNGVLDTTDIFTSRDLVQQADLTAAQTLEAADSKTLTISDEGVYVIKGSAENCTIRVEADDTAKVQLVLDGVSITNSDSPAIYVVSADKCFITTAENSKNTLAVTGSFTADGDTNTDAVIFSKDDIVFGGMGSLEINSAYGNGISGKDDVKFTGGTYSVTSALDAIEANDSIRICGGDFTITGSKDGLHSENDEDNTTGYIYIAGGNFTIDVSGDGIQATTYVQIDGGTFDINASEAIEGTYIQINDGTINAYGSDDGINASSKSTACDVCIEINGGEISVEVGPGDTDGIDSNGNIIVNGGTISVTSQMSSFDYDGVAQFNGGTIIVNGQQVNEIPQSMMGGGMQGGMRGGMRGDMGDMGEMPDFGGMRI